MADFNGNGILDLVAYEVQKDYVKITIVVFLRLSNGNFDNRVISPIQLDHAIGDRLTRELTFNKAQTSHIYIRGNQRTKAAMIVFFDRYNLSRVVHCGALDCHRLRTIKSSRTSMRLQRDSAECYLGRNHGNGTA